MKLIFLYREELERGKIEKMFACQKKLIIYGEGLKGEIKKKIISRFSTVSGCTENIGYMHKDHETPL